MRKHKNTLIILPERRVVFIANLQKLLRLLYKVFCVENFSTQLFVCEYNLFFFLSAAAAAGLRERI